MPGTVSSRATTASTQVTMFQLRERIDLDAAAAVLASEPMHALRQADVPAWKGIADTVGVAQYLGGYVPVRYYMDLEQDGFGRMKAEVMADGKHALPFTRMRRDVRAHLAAKHYWDVDMVNCAPSIFRQDLALHAIPCPLLDRYVTDRAACIAEVMQACSVDRASAKQLFLRLMFFGGIRAWVEENRVPAEAVPAWVRDLKAEMRTSATALLESDEDEFRALRAHHACRGMAPDLPHCTNRVASMMALYLQKRERECVCALVEAVQAEGRAVGAIIYDGIMVERDGKHDPVPDAKQLDKWARAVQRKTKVNIALDVKPFAGNPAWLQPTPGSTSAGRDAGSDDTWMDGTAILTYDRMKALWERRSFKIVTGGNFVREKPAARAVVSEHELMVSYRHLSYDEVSRRPNGAIAVSSKPFISRWINDKTIQVYDSMVLAPPPLVAPPSTYNIWSEPAVARYAPVADKPVDPDSEGVRLYLGFIDTLCSHDAAVTKYVLDWMAQLFQQPGRKTGIAILLKGEEGVGKNRWTDLLRLMLGDDKFLQTANPSSTLYGRFTRLREGKLLIVVNETKGSDSFSSADIIKDMITCDQFVCEGKGTNAYPMDCFARFMFTSNNDNCLKVNPDSRRYLVIDVSSELRGNTAYFTRLTLAMEDPHTRHEFWTRLMARDLQGVDWINHRPATTGMQDMVARNLPYEHQYLKALVLESLRADSRTARLVKSTEALYLGFTGWLASNNVVLSYNSNNLKFGHVMTKLVRDDIKRTGFRSVSKGRMDGPVYIFDVPALAQDMRDAKWLSLDELMTVTNIA